MPKIKLTSTNKKIAILVSLLVILLGVTTIFIPLFLMRLIPQSGIGSLIFKYFYLAYFSIPILLYFIYTGVYYYSIKIDSYVIDIRSYRTISGFFKPPNYIDISHAMLDHFSFFNRPFSFNKTLMLKIKTTSGKTVAKRFNLTFLSKKEEKKITKILAKIIAKNS